MRQESIRRIISIGLLLTLVIDPEISSLMEYFEIFTKRMLLCRKAAQRLGCAFRLKINGQLVA